MSPVWILHAWYKKPFLYWNAYYSDCKSKVSCLYYSCISSHMYKQMFIFAEICATFITGIYFNFISVLRFLLNVPTALTDMAMFNVAMPQQYFYIWYGSLFLFWYAYIFIYFVSIGCSSTFLPLSPTWEPGSLLFKVSMIILLCIYDVFEIPWLLTFET